MNKIVNWSLRVEFKTKEQQKIFIEKLFKDTIDYQVEFSSEADLHNQFYIVEIIDTPWASNLSRVAQMLEDVDEVV